MNTKNEEALRLAETFDHPLPPEWSDMQAAAAELRRLHAENEGLRAELEREQMRLAACGVVAMSDTPESAGKARDMHPDYRSASCEDVARRVDECMHLRARIAELESQMDAIGAGGVGPLVARRVDHQHESNSDNDLPSKNGQLSTSSSIVPLGWKLAPAEPTQAMLSAWQSHFGRIEGAYAAMLAAAPQPPQVEQEPAAYLFQHSDTGMTEFVDVQQVEWGFEKNNPRWNKIGPVYTRPQPQREPLTRDCIRAILLDQGFTIKPGEPDLKPYVYDAIRAIERAHGIGGEA